MPLHCNEPGASPCADGESCVEFTPGVHGCAECVTNADCGCGSCIQHRCYTRPGFCELGCP